jgi:CheY-like chemotaxis protein
MTNPIRHHILIVDDEECIRDTTSLLLADEGYEVNTAADGLEALLQMRTTVPDVIISDLNMPRMSGFEFLSVVRRRFPNIPVIAMSGAYQQGDHIPGGVVADAFFPKGHHKPGELIEMVAELIRTTATRALSHHQHPAPVWIPRNGRDAQGIAFVVLTCTECLRSFPLSVLREEVQEIQGALCRFCSTQLRFIVDFSVAVFSPRAAVIATTVPPPPPAQRPTRILERE